MKILCFGDSNTYGFNPSNSLRYEKQTRWTGILQEFCPRDIEIIEAGCNNRTAFSENPAGINQTGYKILPEYLKEKPDIIILSLGINDLQKFYNPSIEDIKCGITNLINICRQYCPNAQIILVSPPKLSEKIIQGSFAFQFDKTSIQKSEIIGEIYKIIAQEKNCKFLNLDKHVKVSPKDGLHFAAKTHQIIAELLFNTITDIISF